MGGRFPVGIAGRFHRNVQLGVQNLHLDNDINMLNAGGGRSLERTSLYKIACYALLNRILPHLIREYCTLRCDFRSLMKIHRRDYQADNRHKTGQNQV